MKHVLMGVLSIGAVALPAFAEDTVPYAYRPPLAGESYVPGLGTIMEAIQWRHIKLAYAGRSANWELASYVLGQMQESLSDAARLYQGIPIEEVDMIEQPMMALSDAVKSKDGPRFTRAFADLTGACNSCHHAACGRGELYRNSSSDGVAIQRSIIQP